MIDTLGGRYELGKPLGAGGMARVFAARDLRLHRRVAVKLVDAGSVDPVGRQRFVREAQSSAGFSHPNAVAVYDAGEADGSLFLVMELVDGPSLAAQLRKGGPMPTTPAVAIADDVLAALGAAHAAGIVHRDVKPGNILLGPDGRAKLADFGIAKRLDDLSGDLTSVGEFVGTPKYLAPEQVVGEPSTAATDLYSLGVVLYEMVTGRAPYDGGTPLATAIAHRDAAIPDVRAAAVGLPDHVAATIQRALAKDPADRYSSAAEMRAALAGTARPSIGATAAAAAVAAGGVGASALGATAVAPIAPPTARYSGRPELPPTSPLPPSTTGSTNGGRRPWWLAVLAVAVLVAAIAVAAALAGGDADDVRTDATSSAADTTAPVAPVVAPATAAITDAPPATAAPAPPAPPATAAPATAATAAPATPAPTAAPAPPPVPTTVAELRALLESDPSSFGEEAGELIDELLQVEEENGRQRADRAADLLARIDERVADGALSPVVAALAGPILEPLAAGSGNSGQGNGGDDGDDD